MNTLLSIFLLLGAVIGFAITLNIHQLTKRRGDLPAIPGGTPAERIKNYFIVGTDNDLKMELAFILYASLAIFLTNRPPLNPRSSFQLLPAFISLIIGFHFRQWLSKWRLFNIVSIKRLSSDSLYVWKSNSIIAFILTNALIWYLLYLNPFYSSLQLLGVFIHEVAQETRKNTLVLRRRLHLFDLESFAYDKETARVILRVTRPFGLPRLERFIPKQNDPKKKLILRAFRELITNDQPAFRRLLDENSAFILTDPDLCYYFGRALYTLGDISTAEELLNAGCREKPDIRCAAYLALVALAPGKNPKGAEQARTLLAPFIKEGRDSAGNMFAHAYYALASIMLADTEARLSAREAREALTHIHNANRINESFLAKKNLGKFSYGYYRGNELILMDICGYIVFRLGEPRLAYRILEGAINADNTYPWSYFHIALIYQRSGKSKLASSLFTRIALNERTDSVIYRLATERLGR